MALPPKVPSVPMTGRVRDNELIPYYSRKEIQGAGALGKNGSPIAYVNEVDLFFLQIQGSGTLRFRDGRRIKIGYAASNGHPYRSIGALLVRRGEMELEEVTLQSIRAYLAASEPLAAWSRRRGIGPLVTGALAALAVCVVLSCTFDLAFHKTEISGLPWQPAVAP